MFHKHYQVYTTLQKKSVIYFMIQNLKAFKTLVKNVGYAPLGNKPVTNKVIKQSISSFKQPLPHLRITDHKFDTVRKFLNKLW